MPVEMIGWIAPRVSSELIPPSGPPFDAGVIAETARIHEQAGFDRVLIGYFSDAPDGFLIGADAASVTERLGFLLAHRPFHRRSLPASSRPWISSAVDAWPCASSPGGSDANQAKDGDWTDHETRYRHAREYVSVLRRTWTEPVTFDHQSEFYRTRGTYSEIRCRQQPHIPIYGGGGSEAAINALAPHVDVYMLWSEPVKDTAAFMSRVRSAAASYGRNLTFTLPTRPILAATDGAAWDRAQAILDQVLINRGRTPAPTRQNVGSKRLLQAGRRGRGAPTLAYGRRWRRRPRAQGNSTALSPRPEPSRRRYWNTTSSAPPAC